MDEATQPWVTVGDYDDAGCWHPRWMDDEGNWHAGWGWFDDDGEWVVKQGHLDSNGAWVEEVAEQLVMFDGEPVPEVDEEPLPKISRFDDQPLPFIGSSAAAHVAFLLCAMMMPDSAGALDLDNYDAQDRFVQAALTDLQEEKPPIVAGFASDSAPAPETAKHAGEEGQTGDPTEADVGKRIAIRGPEANEDLKLSQARNQEIAMASGVASQLSSIWATSDETVGADALTALGNLDGDEMGPSNGVFGMGVRGDGRGGGGHEGDSLGRHNVDTTGLSGVERGCRGVKCGAGGGIDGDWDKDTKVPPKVVGLPPKVIGSLDREIIRRVVRKHRRELANCYEQELQKNSKLAGRLMVKFTINDAGHVIAALNDAGDSTLKSPAVSSCVTSRVRRWVFPRTPGQEGLVIVRYPFNFSAGDR